MSLVLFVSDFFNKDDNFLEVLKETVTFSFANTIFKVLLKADPYSVDMP